MKQWFRSFFEDGMILKTPLRFSYFRCALLEGWIVEAWLRRVSTMPFRLWLHFMYNTLCTRKFRSTVYFLTVIKDCFICFMQKFSVVRRTEISIMKCTYRNFCTPHYRKFLREGDETIFNLICHCICLGPLFLSILIVLMVLKLF